MDPLRFSIQLKEREVILDNGTTTETFKLRQMTGTQRERYMDTLRENMEVIDEGDGKTKTKIKKMEGMQTALLLQCMFDQNNKPVTKAFLESLPAAVVEGLHAAASELSGMGEKAVQALKNA